LPINLRTQTDLKIAKLFSVSPVVSENEINEGCQQHHMGNQN
jgi:hypothetical protein